MLSFAINFDTQERDLGTPNPHKGSICYEKEFDHFSICYGDNVSV